MAGSVVARRRTATSFSNVVPYHRPRPLRPAGTPFTACQAACPRRPVVPSSSCTAAAPPNTSCNTEPAPMLRRGRREYRPRGPVGGAFQESLLRRQHVKHNWDRRIAALSAAHTAARREGERRGVRGAHHDVLAVLAREVNPRVLAVQDGGGHLHLRLLRADTRAGRRGRGWEKCELRSGDGSRAEEGGEELQGGVADLHSPVLLNPPRPNGDNLPRDRRLLGRLRQEDAPGGLLGRGGLLDEKTVPCAPRGQRGGAIRAHPRRPRAPAAPSGCAPTREPSPAGAPNGFSCATSSPARVPMTSSTFRMRCASPAMSSSVPAYFEYMTRSPSFTSIGMAFPAWRQRAEARTAVREIPLRRPEVSTVPPTIPAALRGSGCADGVLAGRHGRQGGAPWRSSRHRRPPPCPRSASRRRSCSMQRGNRCSEQEPSVETRRHADLSCRYPQERIPTSSATAWRCGQGEENVSSNSAGG